MSQEFQQDNDGIRTPAGGATGMRNSGAQAAGNVSVGSSQSAGAAGAGNRRAAGLGAAASGGASDPAGPAGSASAAGNGGPSITRSTGELMRRGGRSLASYARDPFSLMQQFSEEMDHVFNTFLNRGGGGAHAAAPHQAGDWSGAGWRGGWAGAPLWSPEIDVQEQENQLRVCVDLPGVPREDVQVRLQEGALCIEGQRREVRQTADPDGGWHRSERRHGRFYRSIPLPEGAETDAVQASMKDGVLEVTVPLGTARQGRRIEIRGS